MSRTLQTRRRALTACEECRRKKLRCDAERPSCHNCSVQGKDCIQIALLHRPRPTNRRIEQLEEENRRLRQLVASLPSHPTVNAPAPERPSEAKVRANVSDPRSATPSEEGNEASRTEYIGIPSEPDSTGQTPGTRMLAEAPDRIVSHYHGPTSAFFDESDRHPNQELSNSKDTSDSDRFTRCLLVAASARQRHVEGINLAAGNLDFDGMDPELGMHLLSIYWSRALHCGLIVYRPAFMRDMACGGPYFSKLLLNAIYFAASKHSPRTEIRQDADDKTTAGWLYRQKFTNLLGQEYDKSKITTIQALLIVAVSLFSRCDERSASWLYAGNAFNMIIDLGFHVFPLTNPDKNRGFEEDLEVRRRVYWGAYVLDKIQCLYQGRPPILRISDANIAMEFMDDHEELEPFDPTSFTETWRHGAVPLRYTSTLKKLCELSVIMERILTNLYAGNYPIKNPDSFYWDSMTLQLELEDWWKALPPHQACITSNVRKAPPLPHQLSVLALHNVLIILLHRPLIVERHHLSSSNPSLSPTLAYKSFAACFKAANNIVQILRIYKQEFFLKSAPYLLSYATFISATILVRVIAQKGNGSSTYSSLMTCLEALEEHKYLYAAAGRAKAAIDRLMIRIGVTTVPAQIQQDAPSLTFQQACPDFSNMNQTAAPDTHSLRAAASASPDINMQPCSSSTTSATTSATHRGNSSSTPTLASKRCHRHNDEAPDGGVHENQNYTVPMDIDMNAVIQSFTSTNTQYFQSVRPAQHQKHTTDIVSDEDGDFWDFPSSELRHRQGQMTGQDSRASEALSTFPVAGPSQYLPLIPDLDF